jgi:hypothetical protein
MPSRELKILRAERPPRCRVSSLQDLGRLRQPGAVIAAGVLAALAGAGCGATRERPGLSRAQFVASANAVCSHEQAKLAFIEARARRLGHAATAPAVIRQRVAQSQLATARLEGLPEPPPDSRSIKRWLTARTVAATIALDLAEAPAKGEPLARRDVAAALGGARARARTLARTYGSQVCGETD